MKKIMIIVCLLIVSSIVLVPLDVYAQSTAVNKISGFFANIKSILDAVSVVVVTIALIFAGYQIAFAHKRIIDVAPILIGAMLIGAAAQIAAMLVV
jgi:type IV secretion system protein VirB2